MAAIRTHLTFANVMSVMAVFIALGGSAIAINKIKANSVGSKQLKTGAVKNADLANNAVNSPKVENGSLKEEDFAANQLPRGATGPQGPQGQAGPTGPQGAQGATGTVDTSNFYDKAASDARFLGITATAQNSQNLGGVHSTAFPIALIEGNTVAAGAFTRLGFSRRVLAAPAGTTTILSVGLLGQIEATCTDPATPHITYRNTEGDAQAVSIQNMVGGAFSPFASVAGGATSATVDGSGAVQGQSRFNFIVGSGQSSGGSSRNAVFDVTTVTAPGGVLDNSCVIQVQSQSLIYG